MTDNSLGNFDDLLDPDFQDHVIEVMKGWCTGKYSAQDASQADLVETQISKSLKFWINEALKERKAGNYSDIEAAEKFAVKASDIIYILRCKTRQLYPEHVAMLNDVWSEFQRSIAYHLHIKTRILENFIDTQPSIENSVTEELQRRNDEEKQKRESRKNKARAIWQKAGVDGARKYSEENEQAWLKEGERILKENRKIKSVSQLAIQIGMVTEYPSGTWETIRKRESIIKLFKKHNLRKNTR